MMNVWVVCLDKKHILQVSYDQVRMNRTSHCAHLVEERRRCHSGRPRSLHRCVPHLDRHTHIRQHVRPESAGRLKQHTGGFFIWRYDSCFKCKKTQVQILSDISNGWIYNAASAGSKEGHSASHNCMSIHLHCPWWMNKYIIRILVFMQLSTQQ